MQLDSQVEHFPKAGSSEDEYEDALWPEVDKQIHARTSQYAIADGATESSFSGLWARILVRAFCKGKLHEDLNVEELSRLQAAWFEEVSSLNLPWYAEEKLRDGAFSSLLGVKIEDDSWTDANTQPVTWKAMSVGDSCLFHVRDDKLVKSFPYERSDDFNSRPALIASMPSFNRHLSDFRRLCSGTFEIGDKLYLMTDALACWFLTQYEAGGKPWTIKKRGWYAESWVRGLRQKKQIRNDDVTLMIIERLRDKG
jgi:hypothetical protein